jgi:2-amino-4-hydroxy-6-hydroxymethyldihydropteridine diphosphokinase
MTYRVRARALAVAPVHVDVVLAEGVALGLGLGLGLGLAALPSDVNVGAVSSRAPVQALVALGANLGDARARVLHAIEALGRLPHTRCVRSSPLYRTAPVEAQGPDFINAVVLLETTMTAPDLLLALQALEMAAGRERPYPNAPRTLDLDVITYGDACVSSPRLTVPHPRWLERAFVVHPLRDVAPERVSQDLLAAVSGQIIERLE